MSEAFVFGTKTSTVTLGVNGYEPLLIITNSANISPATYGAVGVYAPSLPIDNTLTNYGTVIGGTGRQGQRPNIPAGVGGIGVYFKGTDSLTNYGKISGGYGGYGSNGGAGGTGVGFASASSLINDDTITGGNGGEGGGTGGAGIDLAEAGTLLNNGMISGGNGGFVRAGLGSNGGAGVNLGDEGILLNNGTITGGQGNSGGDGGLGSNGSNGGSGGTGIIRNDGYGGTLVNTSIVAGGVGGAGVIGGNGGIGGAGIGLYIGGDTLTLTSDGTIIGGAGGIGGSGDTGIPEGNGGTGGFGVELLTNGTVINDGIITGGIGGYGIVSGGTGGVGISIFTGTVFNDGTIIGGTGGGSYSGGSGAGGLGITLNAGTLVNAGVISGGGGGREFKTGATGSVGEAITFGPIASTLIIEPGAVFNGAVVANNAVADVLEFAGASSTEFSGIGVQFSGFQNIDFSSGASWSIQGTYSAFDSGQTIVGFSPGNTITLDNFVANTLDTSYVADTGLELTSTTGNEVTLDITGNFSTQNFVVTNTLGDTAIEVVICYLLGTKISTPAGEVPIEKLKIGDPVITKFNGYRKIKWIGRQSYAKRFVQDNRDQIPVRITACAFGERLPIRDLFVSPGHSMLIGGVLVLAKNLVNGITITQDWIPEQIHYYQIEFETHDCVMAEGVWSESYAETPDFRNKFHNVNEFYALYPDYQEPESQVLCASRPIDGPILEKALRPIVARAATNVIPGNLRGFIDEATASGYVRGWAWDECNPELPILLEISAHGRVIGTVLACDHRNDLKNLGFGQGNCAFSFVSPVGLPLGEERDIQIRRAVDGTDIFMTEDCLIKAGIKFTRGKKRALKAA